MSTSPQITWSDCIKRINDRIKEKWGTQRGVRSMLVLRTSYPRTTLDAYLDGARSPSIKDAMDFINRVAPVLSLSPFYILTGYPDLSQTKDNLLGLIHGIPDDELDALMELLKLTSDWYRQNSVFSKAGKE